ncbi:MAG: hypothetical protein WA432_02905 [Candidatus Babeliaceae bacterium]
MKILLCKKWDNDYSSDTCRHDDFRMLGEFLIEIGWDPYFMEWLQEPGCDETTTELSLRIEKINGRVKIDFPDPEDGIFIDPIPYDPFYEWVSRLVQLSADFYEMVKTIAPNEIAIMYENGQYYLKPIFLRSIAFRRVIRKELEAQKEYDMQGFHVTSKVGAFGMFLVIMDDFNVVRDWLYTEQQEMTVPMIKLIKEKNKITVIYEPEDGRVCTAQVSLSVFPKIIEYYEQFSSKKLDAFLLIEEPEHYSFMINPHEEIKIPIS